MADTIHTREQAIEYKIRSLIQAELTTEGLTAVVIRAFSLSDEGDDAKESRDLEQGAVVVTLGPLPNQANAGQRAGTLNIQIVTHTATDKTRQTLSHILKAVQNAIPNLEGVSLQAPFSDATFSAYHEGQGVADIDGTEQAYSLELQLKTCG